MKSCGRRRSAAHCSWAALVALIWVNSPAGGSYEALRELRAGPSALHLDLSLGTWAADGLLAIFFFVAGLELKREFVAGDLADPRRAAMPVIAVIAVFYTTNLHLTWFLLALVPLAIFTFLVQRRVRSWWLLIPLACGVWAFVHASGVHPTVAGVLLASAVPVPRRDGGAGSGLAEQFEHHFRPVSAAFAVPIFAFFSAGVGVGGWHEFSAALTDPITLGVGIGTFGGTWIMARFTKAKLDDDLEWLDVFGLSVLAGVGFTVSLLIGELAFGAGSEREEFAKVGILMGSLTAAVLATVILRVRDKKILPDRRA